VSQEPGCKASSLDEVYSSENLPPITKANALASGERRVLQQMGIAELPERLQVVQTRTYQYLWPENGHRVITLSPDYMFIANRANSGIHAIQCALCA
jgi:hypothetical protein